MTNATNAVSASHSLISDTINGLLTIAKGGTNNNSYATSALVTYDGSKLASTAVGSSWQITSSWANKAVSASYAPSSGTGINYWWLEPGADHAIASFNGTGTDYATSRIIVGTSAADAQYRIVCSGKMLIQTDGTSGDLVIANGNCDAQTFSVNSVPGVSMTKTIVENMRFSTGILQMLKVTYTFDGIATNYVTSSWVNVP